jgi:hypothetical protein
MRAFMCVLMCVFICWACAFVTTSYPSHIGVHLPQQQPPLARIRGPGTLAYAAAAYLAAAAAAAAFITASALVAEASLGVAAQVKI